MNKQVLSHKILTYEEVNQFNPQVLAFVGDGVYTITLRTHFAEISTAKSGALHLLCNKYVSAPAQSEHLELLLPLFTDIEADMMRRARNTHVHSIAKNANVEQYKKATAFEAVFGYLYLTGQYDRIYEFVNLILEKGSIKK